MEIGAAAGLPSGTVHPILARLEGVRWLQSRWEDIDPRVEGRPARRYYRLTADGVESARAALASGLPSRRIRRSSSPFRDRHDHAPGGPWCCRVVELAARVLPTEQRHRYALEFIAELYGVPRSQQVRHSVHVLSQAWALRHRARRNGPGTSPGEDHDGRDQPIDPLPVEAFHRWRWASTEDGDRYEHCVRCGRDKTEKVGGNFGRRV